MAKNEPLRVKCRSGVEGWQCHLQDNYEDCEEWAAYAEMYKLHLRLGYETPGAAWDANPLVQGSIEPSDFCRVVDGKRCFSACGEGETAV
jgi:hypothetical protein